MAGWTKAQFDANYSFRCERYLPSVIQTGRPEVRLNYYSHFMRPILANRWDNIVSNILDITSSDKVVVMGAAFGWGVDRLIELTGCEAVGLDISDYVESDKTISEDADLIAAIQLVGLDETVGRGLETFNFYSNPNPRTTATIFKEDLLTPASRQRVKTGMNNFDQTLIITEDMFQDLTSLIPEH